MTKHTMPARIDVSSSPEIEKKLNALIASESPTQLACDFSQTDYVSSAGLRIMLVMTKKLKSTGGEFILFGLKEPVLDVFKLAGFDALMDIRATVD